MMKVQQVYKITYMYEDPFKDEIAKTKSIVKDLKEQGFIIEGFKEIHHNGIAKEMEITMAKFNLM